MKQLLLFLLVAAPAFAETFLIAGTPESFTVNDGLLIARCEKECEALKSVRKHASIDLKNVRKGQRFANSTGSDVCDKVYGAGSLLGQASNKDRRAFCLFKDGSLVEMNSLSEYLEERKIVR